VTVVIGDLGHCQLPPKEKTWRKLAAFGIGHPFWQNERAYLPVEVDGGFVIACEPDGEHSRLDGLSEGVPLDVVGFVDLEERVSKLREELEA